MSYHGDPHTYNGDPTKARIENVYLKETVQNAPIDPIALPGLELRGFGQACLGVQRTGDLINLMIDKGMLKVREGCNATRWDYRAI